MSDPTNRLDKNSDPKTKAHNHPLTSHRLRLAVVTWQRQQRKPPRGSDWTSESTAAIATLQHRQHTTTPAATGTHAYKSQAPWKQLQPVH